MTLRSFFTKIVESGIFFILMRPPQRNVSCCHSRWKIEGAEIYRLGVCFAVFELVFIWNIRVMLCLICDHSPQGRPSPGQVRMRGLLSRVKMAAIVAYIWQHAIVGKFVACDFVLDECCCPLVYCEFLRVISWVFTQKMAILKWVCLYTCVASLNERMGVYVIQISRLSYFYKLRKLKKPMCVSVLYFVDLLLYFLEVFGRLCFFSSVNHRNMFCVCQQSVHREILLLNG